MRKAIGMVLALLFAVSAHAQALPPAPYALSGHDVEEAVAKALIGAGVGQHVAAEAPTLHAANVYESQVPVAARITGLNVDKGTSRWNANLLVVNGGGAVLNAQPITGRYQEMVSLPVLKRSLRTGDVISENDIDKMDFPLARTRNDAINDPMQMIGMAARGGISQNRPVRASELTSPSVLKKSAVVQMIFRGHGIEITTSGQALTPGAKGDVIEVRNLNSHQVVRAVVQDAQTVVALPVGETHAEK